MMTTIRSLPSTATGGNTSRRGIAGVWLVLSLPLFIIMLGLVLNIGFLWLAQAELENAASSGALAGAEVLSHHHHDDDDDGHHHDHGLSAVAIKAAKQFVAANRLHGRALTFGDDGSQHAKHGNKPCRITVLLGSVKNGVFYPSRRSHGHHARPKTPPHKHPGQQTHDDDGDGDDDDDDDDGHHKHETACFVKLSCQVEGLFGWLCGSRTVHVTAVAVVGKHGPPRLVEIHRVHREK